MRELTLNRDVTKEECFWLDRDFKKGEKVYEYTGHTYGCIQGSGTACSLVPGETPFFELPTESIMAETLEEQKAADNERMLKEQTEEQPFVTIEKVQHNMEVEHPNGINEGYQRQGILIKRPTVGESVLVSRVQGYFRTSPVMEILLDKEDGGEFRTSNSTYKWVVVKDNATAQAEA